eukprot:m.699782 g.699782  ORF g.699782 m.699782 type:complete len:65 (-) comp22906_c0_seq19:269-463(-)
MKYSDAYHCAQKVRLAAATSCTVRGVQQNEMNKAAILGNDWIHTRVSFDLHVANQFLSQKNMTC